MLNKQQVIMNVLRKLIKKYFFPRRWLFLDDFREPPSHLKKVFDVVRNYDEFVDYIEWFGVPDVISFDHDLHPEHTIFFFDNGGFRNPPDPMFELFKNKTGYDCAEWLISYCKRTGQEFKYVIVHSHNPIGQKNIFNLICNYQKHKYKTINCKIIRWKHQKSKPH